jgi:hypothetical protein
VKRQRREAEVKKEWSYTSTSSRHETYQLLHEIVNKITAKFSPQKPMCFENATKFLNENMICSSKFSVDLITWMFQLHPKKYTFVLIGKTNSGKSHYATLIENCIPFVRLIVFSWSQLRYGNVVLWEEPTITQDDADSAN